MNKNVVQELKNRVSVCNAKGVKTPAVVDTKFFALDRLLSVKQNEFTLAQITKTFETLQTLVQTLEGKEVKSGVAFVAGERMLTDETLTKRAFSIVMKNYEIARIKQESARRIAELESKRANQISKIPLAQKSDFDKVLNTIGANFMTSDIVESELDSDD